jgi:hypothetical protein
MLGLVILMAMLSEMLVVVLNTVPFTTTTAYRAFKVSVYINSVILSLIIATVTAVLFWIVRLQESGIIPEVPECIAGPFDIVDNDDRWHCLGGLNGRERERERERGKIVKDWEIRVAAQKLDGEWRIVTLPWT